MSRWWLLVITALAAGGLIGTFMLMDPGYVQVSWGGLTLETSVWVAIAGLLALWVLVRCLVTLIRMVRRGVSTVASLPAARRAAKSRETTSRGLLLWAEGDLRESLRLLADAAPASELPLVNHLFAAASAQGLGDARTRDHHLEAATTVAPAGAFAISLTRAGYLLEQNDPAAALALLKLLYSRAPKHPLVVRRLFAAAEAAADWAMALEVLGSPVLRDVIGEAAVKAGALRIWEARLRSEAAEAVWAEVPAVLRSEPALIIARAERSNESVGVDKACEILEQALRQQWNAELLVRYGKLRPVDPASQLRRVETLLAGHAEDPALLLLLGRIALRAGELDKAESYLKPRMKQVTDAEGTLALARVSLKRGDTMRAAGLFEQVFQD